MACLVVVGRTAPPPAAVERLAEALTGAAVPLLSGWYQRAEAMREMTGPQMLAAEADRHPDLIAEAIRWQICEGELLQIIGRGRGVNRREKVTPLDVLVLTDVALPLPIAETLVAADLAPGPAELMLAAGGIAFENARHAAQAYPALWPSHEAVRKALRRGVGLFRIRTLLYGNVPLLSAASTTSSPSPGRSQPSPGTIPRSVPDPEAFLVGKARCVGLVPAGRAAPSAGRSAAGS